MIADKIKMLRNANNMTQSELARKLNITRSSVNAWEMGISIPSTTFIVELAQLFRVSTDYLLDLPTHNSIDISTLNETEISIVYSLIRYFHQNSHCRK
ncbi:MAG TPA: XRE family transcriptional regulator [Lachnospiraceae bacterium]|nr:XRE family transcriptional regulator [Lachnospiraceae bacterium]